MSDYSIQYKDVLNRRGGGMLLWAGINESLDSYMTRVYEGISEIQHTVSRETLITLTEVSSGIIIDKFYGLKNIG